MKKLTIALLSLTALIAVAIGIAAWKIGAIVESYKPTIEQSLSAAVGARVTLGTISVSLLPSTTLSVNSVTVQSSNGAASDLSVGSIEAKAALAPLLSKRVELSSIAINAPRVTIIRDAQGISVRGLRSGPSNPQSPVASNSTGPSASTASNFKVDIHSFEINDGAVKFEDRIANASHTIDSINANSSIALEGSAILLGAGSLSMRALSKHNLELHFSDVSLFKVDDTLRVGSSTLKTTAGDIRLSGSIKRGQAPSSLQLASTSLTIPTLMTIATSVVPTLPPQPVTGALGMKMNIDLQGAAPIKLGGTIDLKDISYSQPQSPKVSGIRGSISVTGSPSDLVVAAPSLTMNVENNPLQVSVSGRVTPQELSLTSCKIVGFGGESSLPGTLSLTAQTLKTTPSARSLSLAQLFTVASPSLARTIQGTLSSFNGQFSDILPSNAARTVSGSGAMVMKDGILKGFNIANQVMSNIDGLPFISGNLRKRVPPEFEKYFSSPDTVVRELSAKFAISKGVIQLSELILMADIFSLTSQGSVAIEGKLDLKATIAFAPDLSNAITARVLEMKPLLNKEGRLAFPLLVKGTAPAVVVLPDLTDIAQRAAVGTVRETLSGALKGGTGAAKGLGKGIGKVFGF